MLEGVGDVSATSLVTLYCHAIEARSDRPILADPRSVAIAAELNRLLSPPADPLEKALVSGTLDRKLVVHIALRAKRYDDYVREFLARHPDGVVVNIKLDQHLKPGQNTVVLQADSGTAPVCQIVGRYYTEKRWTASRQSSQNPVTITYDKSPLQAGDIVKAQARILLPQSAAMAMVDLAIPPGFMPLTEDLERLKAQGNIERYEITGTQIIIYLRKLPSGQSTVFNYRLRALYPIKATVRPSAVYPYYEPQTRYESAPGTVTVL
jgi:hypothetical protein